MCTCSEEQSIESFAVQGSVHFIIVSELQNYMATNEEEHRVLE